MDTGLITSIRDMTAKKKLIYINEKPAFALYNHELKSFDLKENSIISDSCYTAIAERLSKRAKIRAMNLLKSKDYTRHELMDKLEQSYYPHECILSAIAYAEHYGYVNDARYAENYIAFKAKSKSRKQIEQFLKEKGIEADMIAHACEAYYGDSTECEMNIVLDLLNKKYKDKAYEDFDYKLKQKIMAYMYRKGFSIDTINKAIYVFLDNIRNKV